MRTEIERRRQEAEREEVARNAEAIRRRCQTLSGFIREAWHVVEPYQPYVHGWHIDFLCMHLQAITEGRLTERGSPNRLMINVPPGMAKSLLVSVFWPAWEWGPANYPALRYLTTSYSADYAKRDARRMRDLVESDWYQHLWGDHVRLVRSGETSFANSARGSREGMPFASLTGGRGDRVIIDDPHSTETAESNAERARTTRIFRESVPLRLNDPATSAIVVIMQRLHSYDVSGTEEDLDLGYIRVVLPMEFEPERRCETPIAKDPREFDGELLFPERFPREVVERDKVPLGSYGVSGQFQQRPTPREGGMFKRHWFADKTIKAAPEGTIWWRYWDLAGTKRKENDPGARSAGVKMGRAPDGTIIVGHAVAAAEEGHHVRQLVKATAQSDGRDVSIGIPQDPGSAGKTVAQDYVRMLSGYNARIVQETGDKVTRADPFAAQCEAGNVYLVEGSWNEMYLDEICQFPGGPRKDLVDASSGAFSKVTGSRGEYSTGVIGGLF